MTSTTPSTEARGLREVEESVMYERGQVVWHSSEEEGGPDVGISVGLGKGCAIYAGEISDVVWRDSDGASVTAPNNGWWLTITGPNNMTALATFASQEAAHLLIENIRLAIATTKPEAGVAERAREITPTDILREWFGGERYARDYEYLDANFREPAEQVANYFAALRSNVDMSGMVDEARFLLDRIAELDWSLDRDDFARNWHGHVEPPLVRLARALASVRP